jgi:peptidoglycan L-alanyl-D-glutamate endopeptidase CwlK
VDSLTLQKIQLLHPKIRQETLETYTHINNNLFGKNLKLRFTHTYRSFEEQNEFYKQGRNKLYDKEGNRLPKITNAKGGQSIHNYGLAFDITVLIDKDDNGNFETALWNLEADHDKDNTPDWKEAIACLKSRGWEWGGDWKQFPDYPHFQKTFGYTWQALQKKFLNDDTFTEVIDGKVYKWVNL